jgi:hypothetical protein
MLKFGFNGLFEQSARFSNSGPNAASTLAHSIVNTGNLNIRMFPIEKGEVFSLVSPSKTFDGRGFLMKNPLNNNLALVSQTPSTTREI